MIKQMSQSIAYICPSCAAVTGRLVNIFNFSGKRAQEYSCEAKECDSHIVKIFEKNNKYVISVECAFCGETHIFTISKNAFWTKEFLAFTCPVSEMNVFYIGNPEIIREEVKKQEAELADLSAEVAEVDELSVLLDILSELNDMLDQDAIICECGSDVIMLDVDERGIVLSCGECETTLILSATEEEYQKLIKSDTLVIKK